MIETYYNVFHNVPWGFWIPLYFYFTGLSAGSFVLSSLSTVFGLKQFKTLAFTAGISAVVLLLLAPMFLILDLGQPFRFWKVLVPWYFNPHSVVSWGSWLLTIYPIVLLIYCWYMFKEKEKMVKIFGISTLPLAIAVHGYTGFVFGLIKARVYWYSAIMPGYFLTSAILSGIGLLIIIILIKDKLAGGSAISELFSPLKKMMIAIIILDLFWVFCWKITLLSGTDEARASALIALKDPLYIFGELLVGMFVPLFLLTYPKTRNSVGWLAVSSVLVLIGVFLMRYTLVFTGFEIPLS
ncbi:MAG: putative hydrogenase 2 b cytochrome subunit [Candidatus Scalindua rubra]|uniref:Putative hydrogenase 2 b cytochrome subunit n=1 Tax=Candidatus Scalindua rubra TaxID=1872076 RepID=A0A1E3XAD0_9BACT|nr:MAG: putative hydrogenase 2 b cytochrome subunit [Candidatus Scalindua rubra]